MPDDCGCKNGGTSKDSLSRREFIKTSSLAVAGAALAATPLNTQPVSRILSAPLGPEDIEKALAIAEADVRFQDFLKESAVMGLEIDATVNGAKFADTKDSLVGLVLAQNLSPSRRMGLDIALTVDLSRDLLTSLHMIVGRCLVEILCIDSYTVDYRDGPYLAEKDPRSPTIPQIIQPRRVSFWTFPQVNAPTPKPKDITPVGWPLFAEDANEGYWHYANASKAAWQIEREEFVYRCVEVSETQYVDQVKFVLLPEFDQGG